MSSLDHQVLTRMADAIRRPIRPSPHGDGGLLFDMDPLTRGG
jgi:hypothetical protein